MGFTRIVVIGAGSIGERHIRCFAATGRARVSFVEPRAEVRDRVAAKYGGVQPLESIGAALDRGTDAAVIATPATLHVPQATQLAQRGVHLLIEKPLSVSIDGVAELAAAVAEIGRA